MTARGRGKSGPRLTVTDWYINELRKIAELPAGDGKSTRGASLSTITDVVSKSEEKGTAQQFLKSIQNVCQANGLPILQAIDFEILKPEVPKHVAQARAALLIAQLIDASTIHEQIRLLPEKWRDVLLLHLPPERKETAEQDSKPKLIPASNESTLALIAPAVVTSELPNFDAIRSTLIPPGGNILDVVLIPDNHQVLLVEGMGHKLRVWNLSGRRLTHEFSKHSATVRCASISPDGNSMMSGGADGTLRVWNLVTGEESHYLDCPDGWVNAVSFSSTPHYLAWASGRTVNSCQLGTAETALRFPTTSVINTVTLSGSGRTLFAGGRDNTVWMWCAPFIQPPLQVVKQFDQVRVIASGLDGDVVISGGDDRHIWLFQDGSAEVLGRQHKASISSAAVSSDGQYALTGDRTGAVWIWNIGSGNSKPVSNFKSPIRKVAFINSGNNQCLIVTDSVIELRHLT